MPHALERKRAAPSGAPTRTKTPSSKVPRAAGHTPPAPESSPPGSAPRRKRTTLPPSRARVLVIDDDPLVLDATSDCLSSAGFQVTMRSQALGTSQWITQNDVDLILLDLVMPAMSGTDLAMFLKKRGLTRKLSIILHSEKDAAADAARLVRQTGALGVITKTGDPVQFLAEFERFAERHFRTKDLVATPKRAAKS